MIQMLAGEGVRINTGTFSNDMTTFATKDDVLTLLVHLGYLTYNSETEKVTDSKQRSVTGISQCNQYHGLARGNCVRLKIRVS